jgi:integrase
MVYWNENGKRHDKSFGRGDDARLRAEAFDLVIQQAKAEGIALVQMAPVAETASGPILDAHNTAPVVESVVPVAAAPVATQAAAPVVAAPVAGITFGQLSMMYLDHLRVSGRTDKHIVTLDKLLKNMFFDILGRDSLVEGMTYLKDIVPFIKQMQGVSPQTKKPRSQASVNRYCDYLDAIFHFGIEMELIQKNPMKGRKKAKERPRDVQVGVDDLRRIMDCTEPHVRWAMEVCFNLGTRPGPSELFALRYENVDFGAGTVRIFATKTQTYRTVPVTAAFLDRLREMRRFSRSGYIVEYDGKPVTTIRKSFNKACVKAGITVDVRMYDLRHLFATTMLANGADLAAVSKLMGHSTVKMTADVYYHYLEGEKERAVSKLPSLVAV